jgi:undecaprenyl-diphosphatase
MSPDMIPPLLQAAILGAIQALTEFLPISSSAHLLVLPLLFGWPPLGLFFDVALHYGTALSVLVYFRETWLGILKTILQPGTWSSESGLWNLRLMWILVIGTIPAVVAGLLGKHLIETLLRQPYVAAFCLAFFGIVLVLADRYCRRDRHIKQSRIADGLWVGLAQVLALVPGVSRSGITITAARLRGLDTSDAARLSFLLSTPAIIGAAVFESYEYLKAAPAERPDVVVVAVGTMVSALAGLVCIHYFLRYLRRGNFVPFAVYRIALALLIAWLL